ncbi:hypothetical protein TSOC_012384 [Tetrabaena socialis]|uniref:Uncharacterized protein n=1 Tax=Tetrabaena socialis TaxID=47790 RepID=A0A2J7ZN64_9CHLO|nr:hypothetical protein TSOC_012384 [Tetrabaena socialis]|eukprot:PNH01709.1 hypothetical protein TSOC_012384 [Tetrabaena socialis]
MDGGDGHKDCRYPESLIKTWNVAATWGLDAALLNHKLEVMLQGGPKSIIVNVVDVCDDSDCDGCCKKNTGNKAWKLIDIEKWPASALLGFPTSSLTFDVNDVSYPDGSSKRKGAGPGVMALCYRDVGAAMILP